MQQNLEKAMLFLAPMAGVADLPFRRICREFGADYTVAEMVAANPALWSTAKSEARRDHDTSAGPKIVQIAGADPKWMAEAAQRHEQCGADIIDINMGCPVKKVCGTLAGSALLRDEKRLHEILHAVVQAVSIPVTLKIRTGWDTSNKNALRIAQIAEDCGIHWLTIHGRTRQCGYQGSAEYDTIAEVKQRCTFPVIANGDIDSVEKAHFVLNYTSADGIMIGRAAQGNPWIFREIKAYFSSGKRPDKPSAQEQQETILNHLKNLYDFYGESLGLRIARKHIRWYIRNLPGSPTFWKKINRIDNNYTQYDMVSAFFTQLN